jgi:hypothetical protein
MMMGMQSPDNKGRSAIQTIGMSGGRSLLLAGVVVALAATTGAAWLHEARTPSAGQRSAVAMSFAGIAYQTEERDARALARKIEPLAKFFHDAELQVRAMSAPPSLSGTLARYVGAMALYANAADEMLKFTEDADLRRLDEAHRMDVKASQDVLRVGEVLWPGQYKPH